MRFLVNMWNHNKMGKRSLEDVVGIFGHQLRALGHEIIWDPADSQWLTKGTGVNVIVEGFTPGSVQHVRDLYAQGCRFLCLATEEPTPRGFNHGIQREMVNRQTMFGQAAKHFEGIFYLVPGEYTRSWYSQWAPTAYVELGFAPSMFRPRMDVPEFEFGFYGSLSPRRLKILKRLASRMPNCPNAVRIVADFKSQDERDAEMRRCKIILQLRKFDKMGLVSSSRCCTALHLGRPVICEPHDLADEWKDVVKFTSSLEEFYATAIGYRSCWQGLWHDQFAKFKEKFNPDYCVGRAFREIGFDGVSFHSERRLAA